MDPIIDVQVGTGLEKYILVATVGEDNEGIYHAVKEFPVKKYYIICNDKNHASALDIKMELVRFNIDVQVVAVNEPLLPEMIKAFSKVKQAENPSSILANLSCGTKVATCAALTASFINGLKAFYIVDGKVMFFPIMKLSYYNLLSERKRKILAFLREVPDCCRSMDDLSKKMSMSLPLISYHINGTPEARGLVEEGLVELISGKHGRNQIMLTEMGKLIIEGYLGAESDLKME